MTAARALTATVAIVLLSACSGGAGNLGSLMPSGAAPAAAQRDAAASSSASSSAAPSVPARAAPAGRSAQGAAMPQPTPQVTTPEQINADCWMLAEANKKLRDLDQRLKFVDKCVEERTKGM